VTDSLNVPAPGDCSSAINQKVQHRPIFLPAFPFLVEPFGCWASTVARLQEARRHTQGLAELGYFLFQYVRLMAAGFSRLSIRNQGIRSIAVKMFIIHIFNSVQPSFEMSRSIKNLVCHSSIYCTTVDELCCQW